MTDISSCALNAIQIYMPSHPRRFSQTESGVGDSHVNMTRREANVCWKRLCCFALAFLAITALSLLSVYLAGVYLLRSAMSRIQSQLLPENLNASLARMHLDSPELAQGMQRLRSMLGGGVGVGVGGGDEMHKSREQQVGEQGVGLLLMKGLMKTVMERMAENVKTVNKDNGGDGSLDKATLEEERRLDQENVPEEDVRVGIGKRPLDKLKMLLQSLDRFQALRREQ